MRSQTPKQYSSKAQKPKKSWKTEAEFWKCFHEKHNAHLTTNVGKVTVNVSKKKIKVGYTDIKIDLVKEIPDKNQHVFGEYDPVSQKILLDKNQSERSLANSFT